MIGASGASGSMGAMEAAGASAASVRDGGGSKALPRPPPAAGTDPNSPSSARSAKLSSRGGRGAAFFGGAAGAGVGAGGAAAFAGFSVPLAGARSRSSASTEGFFAPGSVTAVLGGGRTVRPSTRKPSTSSRDRVSRQAEPAMDCGACDSHWLATSATRSLRPCSRWMPMSARYASTCAGSRFRMSRNRSTARATKPYLARTSASATISSTRCVRTPAAAISSAAALAPPRSIPPIIPTASPLLTGSTDGVAAADRIGTEVPVERVGTIGGGVTSGGGSAKSCQLVPSASACPSISISISPKSSAWGSGTASSERGATDSTRLARSG